MLEKERLKESERERKSGEGTSRKFLYACALSKVKDLFITA
jgi:hypothetical protein